MWVQLHYGSAKVAELLNLYRRYIICLMIISTQARLQCYSGPCNSVNYFDHSETSLDDDDDDDDDWPEMATHQ